MVTLKQLLEDAFDSSINNGIYTLVFMGWGYSVDGWNETAEEWEENEMVYLGYPEYISSADTYEEWVEYKNSWEQPVRTHDYKRTYRTYHFELPENHTDASLYDAEQLLGDCKYGDDNPGMGFDYYNLPEDEELAEKMQGW